MRFLKKIPFHPSFYLVIIYFTAIGQLIEFLTFFVVLMIHEFGHFFVSKKLGYTIEKFYIAPYGACLNYKEKQFERSDEVKIALAGPLINIIFAFAVISLWWIFPQTYISTYLFVEQSLFLAIFNLLPAYPLDGGRVIVALFAEKMGRKQAIKSLKILNLLFSILFSILFVISLFVSFNPTLALAVVFLLSGLFDGEFSSKYKNSFLLKKHLKDFSKPKIMVVGEALSFNDLLKRIDRDTFTIFQIVSLDGQMITLNEKQVIEICVKYDGKQKLSKLFEE